MKKYFLKYIPAEDKALKAGDTIDCIEGITTVKSVDGFIVTFANGNGTWIDSVTKVKLMLCSRDIQVGDKVTSDSLAGKEKKITSIHPWSHKPGFTVVLDNDPNGGASSHYYYKVIGEVSPIALEFVKEGDEFDEEDIELWEHKKRLQWTFNQYNRRMKTPNDWKHFTAKFKCSYGCFH